MTQNATLIFDSLFLHDTQMTDLEREQTALRKLYSGLKAERMPATGNGASSIGADRPFNFAQPFCPLDSDTSQAGTEPSGKLTIGAPSARAGWIVRHVSGQKSDGNRDGNDATCGAEAARSSKIDVPGYPPLPCETCFILGYAGDFAKELLRRAESSRRTESENKFGEFSVSARYRATLTLEIAYDAGRSFSSTWSVGPARWEKA